MKYIGLCSVVLFAPLASPMAHVPLVQAAQPGGKPAAYTGPRLSVWVSDFENRIGVISAPSTTGGAIPTPSTASPNAAPPVVIAPGAAGSACPTPTDLPSGLAEIAITALLDSGAFDAVERQAIQSLTEEQTRAGVNQDTAAKANNLKGAQLLLKGALTEFSYSGSDLSGSIPLGFMGGKGDYTAKVGVDVRLIDASTGEIYSAAHGTGGAKSSATTLSFSKKDYNFSNSTFQKSPLAEACRLAIKNAILSLAKQSDKLPVWEAKVALVDPTGLIYINAGKRAGLRVGDTFLVFHPGVSIPDPDDPSKTLGESRGDKVGLIRITEVLADRLSKAEVVSGTGFAAQDRVKLPTTAN